MGRAAVSCFEKAVELLGRRAHFRRELELKLLRRAYAPEEVSATLERLLELKYLDDERTANTFVENRVERSPAGRPLLRSELFRRGVARAVTEGALENVDESNAAKEAAERFLRRRQRPKETPAERRQALLRHLAGRGFAGHLVRQAIDAAAAAESLEAEDLEEALEALDSANLDSVDLAEEAEGRNG